VLFAMKEFPELRPLIIRKFKRNGDVSRALELVERSSGIQKARELAAEHVNKAQEMVHRFPATLNGEARTARESLINLAAFVLNRKK